MLRRRPRPYDAIEKGIGYRFRRAARLEAALVHRSYRFENPDVTEDNQRLEFLGDAVLGLAVAAYLYATHADLDEGALTARRSRVTSGKALSGIAMQLDLGQYLKMGKGEAQSGGRHRASNLTDALEAVIGAAYLDGGFRAVDRLVRRLFVPLLAEMDGDVWAENPKGKLQDYCQQRWRQSPSYRTVATDGPSHAVVFTAEVVVGSGARDRGQGRTKQAAETQAAQHMLRRLEGRGHRAPDESGSGR